MRFFINILIASTFLSLVSCGGGSSGGSSSNIPVTACVPQGDDSTQNIDGSANWIPSHLSSDHFGSTISRYDLNGNPIIINYMVHQPTGTPKAIVVLIAGGDMNAYLTGTGDGGTTTSSGGNFLVRSAHRFATQGYRVITIDRPSDYTEYGDILNLSYLYDAYRNSMDHAVDLATIIKRENMDNLDVLIAGTSRGSISATANNLLAAGIGLSAVLTVSGRGGSPIGSANLPISTIQRPTHILSHQEDSCIATPPSGARSLYTSLEANNINVAIDEVTGGFVDTVRNDPCGAFHYHGFLGIETCAVNKATGWADTLLSATEANFPANSRPVGYDLLLNSSGGTTGFTLSANDIDGDTLSYAIPYSNSSLGGTVSINTNGTGTYVPPNGVTGTTDYFVFVATDNKGGVGIGIVSISL